MKITLKEFIILHQTLLDTLYIGDRTDMRLFTFTKDIRRNLLDKLLNDMDEANVEIKATTEE